MIMVKSCDLLAYNVLKTTQLKMTITVQRPQGDISKAATPTIDANGLHKVRGTVERAVFMVRDRRVML